MMAAMKTTIVPRPFFFLCALGVAIASSGGSARADAWLSAPKVPAAIAVPETAKTPAKVAAHFHATGAQVYACVAVAVAATGPGPATYAWTLQRPDATLLDQKGAPAGKHGAGPIWTAKDGSTVTGKKLAQADAPTADAIPWLLLHADKTSGAGLFSKVTYVQRVATSKGKPPTTKCDATTPKGETRVDYSADYYFYN
jgi:Protein of unknown function (DUF3455)